MRSRRAGKWAALTWAVLVVVGGGLTLWLKAAATEAPPVRPEVTPTPGLSPFETGDIVECPPPTPGPDADPDDPLSWACLTVTRR